MVGMDDIVITGLGCITPIGLGKENLLRSLENGSCGTRAVWQSPTADRIYYGAPIDGFDGKQYVTPRKSLKVMSREVQLSYAAAHLAWEDANLESMDISPERVGVVFGSEMIPGDLHELVPAVRACSTSGTFNPLAWGTEFAKQIFPLWMLRNLPNMPPCHIAIAIDARGPNNTIVQEEVSGLLALGEAISIMSRGDADLMLVGAMGSRTTPTRIIYHPSELYLGTSYSQQIENHHCRPFDSHRAGIVPGEAAVVMVLEKRRHAVARQARLYGTVRAVSSRCGRVEEKWAGSTQALVQATESAIKEAGIEREDVACISPQGFSQQCLDRTEARAIERLNIPAPLTGYSSYFGTCGAASGLLQLASCLLATHSGSIFPTLGVCSPDPEFSIDICTEKSAISKSHLVQLGFTFAGQAAAVVVDCH
jgi:3-oxoacyl-[acyl-carrier-protein] synthase II